LDPVDPDRAADARPRNVDVIETRLRIDLRIHQEMMADMHLVSEHRSGHGRADQFDVPPDPGVAEHDVLFAARLIPKKYVPFDLGALESQTTRDMGAGQVDVAVRRDTPKLDILECGLPAWCRGEYYSPRDR
jgi:hypothetical protein